MRDSSDINHQPPRAHENHPNINAASRLGSGSGRSAHTNAQRIPEPPRYATGVSHWGSVENHPSILCL